MKQRFLVVYEFAEGTYSGYAPDLPGCISSGGTHEEIRANMCEAVGNHVGLMITQGNEVRFQWPTLFVAQTCSRNGCTTLDRRAIGH